MNAQDIRNLSEAYMEVYGELDESRGDDLRKKYRMKSGEVSKRLSRRADIKTFKYERNDPRREALSNLSGNAAARSQGDTILHGSGERIRRGGRLRGTNIHTDADRDRGDKGERFANFVSGERNSPNMSNVERRTVSYKKEETDLYDIILSHLLDEGFASTEQSADKIILNMSESWFEEILNERTRFAKETGKNVRTGRPSVEGGDPKVAERNKLPGYKYGGSKQEPKERGKKPPSPSEEAKKKGVLSPLEHKVALRRNARQRASDFRMDTRGT